MTVKILLTLWIALVVWLAMLSAGNTSRPEARLTSDLKETCGAVEGAEPDLQADLGSSRYAFGCFANTRATENPDAR